MIGSTITVRVTDYDMNRDPDKIEQFNVKVWSDYDLESDFEPEHEKRAETTLLIDSVQIQEAE